MRAEGWKWVEVAPEFPYGHTYGLRRLSGKEVPLTKKETRARDVLKAELDKLEKEYADGEEIPEEVDARLGEIETALGEYEQRPVAYDATEIARTGVFISIGSDGTLHVERGYVRPEDEEPVATGESEEAGEDASENGTAGRPNGASETLNGASSPSGHSPTESDEEDEGVQRGPPRPCAPAPQPRGNPGMAPFRIRDDRFGTHHGRVPQMGPAAPRAMHHESDAKALRRLARDAAPEITRQASRSRPGGRMPERRYQDIWKEQCQAARGVRQRHGVVSALAT